VSARAERIHLRMEGQPQDASEAAALVLAFALKFCAQPETFPAFLAFARNDAAGVDWVLDALRRLKPELLKAVRAQIVAGVAADFEGAQ
jgi:hypothetical protein